MAGLKFVANPGEITTGTSAKTLLQITAPTNQRLKITEWEINCKGTSNVASPGYYRIMRQTSPNGTGTALTLAKWDSGYAETIQSTAKYNFTVEPSSNQTTIMEGEIHPQQGYGWFSPFDGPIVIQGGAAFQIEVTFAASIIVTSRAICEE